MQAIDKEKKVVQTKQGSYSFDYLVLTERVANQMTPGTRCKRNTDLLYGHLEDSVRIRETHRKTVAKAAIVPDAALS